MSGIVTSSGSTVAQFTFPQLRTDTFITHRFEVMNDCTDAMIVGRDLMNALGLILDFKEKLIQWDDCQLQSNTGQSTTLAELDDQHDHEVPEEAKDASDNAVSPEQLVPTDILDENLQQQYRSLLATQAV